MIIVVREREIKIGSKGSYFLITAPCCQIGRPINVTTTDSDRLQLSSRAFTCANGKCPPVILEKKSAKLQSSERPEWFGLVARVASWLSKIVLLGATDPGLTSLPLDSHNQLFNFPLESDPAEFLGLAATNGRLILSRFKSPQSFHQTGNC